MSAQTHAFKRSAGLVVVVTVRSKDRKATARQTGFMLRGLRFVEADLQALGIAFRVLVGANPAQELARYAKAVDAQHVVSDFSPLRGSIKAKDDAVELLAEGCGFEYVDAHNVVPVWVASDKIEASAATIRKKIQNRLPEFLTNFPPVFTLDKLPVSDAAVLPRVRAEARAAAGDTGAASAASSSSASASASSAGPVVAGPAPIDPATGLTDWEAVAGALDIDWSVPEVVDVLPGEREAEAALARFLEQATRVDKYHLYHQDATRPEVCSGLSPYLHFGHLSAQRCCLELLRVTELSPREIFVPRASNGFQAWADEILVRRELSENFCLYEEKVRRCSACRSETSQRANSCLARDSSGCTCVCGNVCAQYDSFDGFPGWARQTLAAHAEDARKFVYSQELLEAGRTHDSLWNAAQMQMVHSGRMHGFCRKYWAKSESLGERCLFVLSIAAVTVFNLLVPNSPRFDRSALTPLQKSWSGRLARRRLCKSPSTSTTSTSSTDVIPTAMWAAPGQLAACMRWGHRNATLLARFVP